MDIRVEEISRIIRKQIEDYDKKVEVSETGTVLSAGDGIARVYGLEQAMAEELIEFPNGVQGMVLNLEEDNVGAALLVEANLIKEGDEVRRKAALWTCRSARPCWGASSTVSVRPSMGLVRSILPTVVRLRSRRQASCLASRSVSRFRRGSRRSTPWCQSAVDSASSSSVTARLVTAVAIDTIINQKNADVYCIYVAVGQKQSTVAQWSS